MSQSGMLAVTSGTLPPSVPTTFTGNVGVATPVAHNLNIVTANSTPQFVGSGSTLTLDFGLSNLALGSSLPSITSGTSNVGMGLNVLSSATSGSQNVGIGSLSLQFLTSSIQNVAIGFGSGRFISSGSGTNTLIGSGSGSSLTTGASNTGIGSGALNNVSTGAANVAIGFASGVQYNAAESSNIVISNNGITGESNIIRIGTQGTGAGQQNQAFMAGITGTTVAASAPMGISSTGQMSSLGFGTIGQVFTSTGPSSSGTFQTPSTFSQIAVQTFLATGTYTPTADMKYCVIEVVGGGGGGGGTAGNVTLSGAGGGGGGGAYARGVFSAATIGASKAVTIGAGGAGGANTGTAGTGGGTTSVGALISSSGGAGGIQTLTPAATGTVLGGAGGANGFVSGQYTSAGGAGTNAYWLVGLVVAGAGGSSGLGSGSNIQRSAISGGLAAGNAGNFAGGGGGGGLQNLSATGAAGGAGSQGYVVITEFI